MGIREKVSEKPGIVLAIVIACVLAAAGIVAATFWPQKKADLSQAFYSDDDGVTWFSGSTYLVPPFEHNGKTAVVAEVYSYDDGKKLFCAYLARFTEKAKTQLEGALADAQRNGKSPESVGLYADPNFMKNGTEVKLPGSNNPWIPYNDPRAREIFSIHSPDGTTVDQYLSY
jgi:hypothetical protein